MNFPYKDVLTEKRTIIIIGSMSFLVIALLAFSFFLPQPQTQQKTEEQITQIISTSPSSATQIVSPTPLQSMLFRSRTYMLYYPKEFSPESFQYSNGEGVVFKKQNTGNTGPFMSIVVEQILPSGATLSQRQEFYKRLGFVKDSIQLGGIAATKLSGSLQVNNSSQSAGKDTTWETHIYLDKKTRSYLVVYKYEAENRDPQLESLFLNMLSTFRFL